MLKRLLFPSLLLFLINFNYVVAETTVIIPKKKPSLTEKEIEEKISQNILKPLKKPKKINIKETIVGKAIYENKISLKDLKAC